MSKKLPFSFPHYNLAEPSGWLNLADPFLRRGYLVDIPWRAMERVSRAYSSTCALAFDGKHARLAVSATLGELYPAGVAVVRCPSHGPQQRVAIWARCVREGVQQHWRPRTACHRSKHVMGCTCEKSCTPYAVHLFLRSANGIIAVSNGAPTISPD